MKSNNFKNELSLLITSFRTLTSYQIDETQAVKEIIAQSFFRVEDANYYFSLKELIYIFDNDINADVIREFITSRRKWSPLNLIDFVESKKNKPKEWPGLVFLICESVVKNKKH